MMKKIASLVLAVLGLYAQAALAMHAGPTPIETLQRPLFRSAPILRTNSNASQYAGRTTLGSGQASVVVSTRGINSDSLIYPTVHVALPAAYVTQGRTSLISADVTKTVSTTAIYSGAIALLAVDAATTLSSGVGRSYRINSIVDGVSFALSTVDSNPSGLTATNLIWSLPTAVPVNIKVNTISPNGFFTLGWPDGIGRPVDVVVMWELRRST